ncbi:MAG: DJ-1/PfpI family protein [Bacteroidota bacterium]
MNRLLFIIIISHLLLSCSSNDNRASKATIASPKPQDSLGQVSTVEEMSPENHNSSMEAVFGKPKHEIQNIGILVYDGVNELDVMGPKYILGQAIGAQTQLISVKGGNIKTVMGVEIVPNAVMDSISQLDILIIPGGFTGTIEACFDEELHRWIRRIDEKTLYTASVCTGAWILGASGLLEGKKASTNWYREEEFLKKYGAVPVNERYTKDGKYWTSAGVTAGMDMSLAILKEIYGESYAQAVMLDMEYDAAPPLIGGSPEKTKESVYNMMLAMYDMGVQPLMDSLEIKNKTVGKKTQKDDGR